MGLLRFLADVRATQIVDELCQQATRRVYGSLREACESRIAQMTHAETRGYVWAKARPIVTTEVTAIAIAHPTLGQQIIDMLCERTHDRVVRNVVSDLMRERTQRTHRRHAA